VIDLIKLAEDLGRLISHDKILFLKTEPEIANFTRPFDGDLLIYGEKRKVVVKLPTDLSDIRNVYNQLKECVFSEGMTSIFWNVKNLISYFKFHNPKDIVLNSKIVDLKLIEAFLGIKQGPPTSLNDALRRLTLYINSEDAKSIHNKIHKPLALEVIPHMETFKGVIDEELNKFVYPSFEIEGQTFGRLNCHKEFDNCITPHNMGDEKKGMLKLKGEKDYFIYFDFKHMEVSMLQWLTGDAELKQAMNMNTDLYRGIYQMVFNEPCDNDNKREMIKSLFLPIMFGLTPFGLERDYGVSEKSANQIHWLIKNKFPTAWKYMEDHHEQAKKAPTAKDYFGRIRSFAEKPISIRGFLVQAASATFCQEKLIELHRCLNGHGNLLYTIHDGYVLVANEENLNKVIINGLKALQSESNICKGLKMRVSCSVGAKLSRLKQIVVNKEFDGNS
jgi:hypothetical protein